MPREIVHVGRRIRVAVDTTTAPDGPTIRRDVILHPGAVVILPVLDARPRRAAAEPPLRDRRDALGSAGRDASSRANRWRRAPSANSRRRPATRPREWRSLGYLYASPGVLDEKLHLFVARGTDARPGAARSRTSSSNR